MPPVFSMPRLCHRAEETLTGPFFLAADFQSVEPGSTFGELRKHDRRSFARYDGRRHRGDGGQCRGGPGSARDAVCGGDGNGRPGGRGGPDGDDGPVGPAGAGRHGAHRGRGRLALRAELQSGRCDGPDRRRRPDPAVPRRRADRLCRPCGDCRRGEPAAFHHRRPGHRGERDRRSGDRAGRRRDVGDRGGRPRRAAGRFQRIRRRLRPGDQPARPRGRGPAGPAERRHQYLRAVRRRDLR